MLVLNVRVRGTVTALSEVQTGASVTSSTLRDIINFMVVNDFLETGVNVVHGIACRMGTRRILYRLYTGYRGHHIGL